MTSFPIFGRLCSQTWKSVYLCSGYFGANIFLSGPINWKIVLRERRSHWFWMTLFTQEKNVRELGCVLKNNNIYWSYFWNFLDSQQATERWLLLVTISCDLNSHFDVANTQWGHFQRAPQLMSCRLTWLLCMIHKYFYPSEFLKSVAYLLYVFVIQSNFLNLVLRMM